MILYLQNTYKSCYYLLYNISLGGTHPSMKLVRGCVLPKLSHIKVSKLKSSWKQENKDDSVHKSKDKFLNKFSNVICFSFIHLSYLIILSNLSIFFLQLICNGKIIAIYKYLSFLNIFIYEYIPISM